MRDLLNRLVFWGLSVTVFFLPIYPSLTSFGLGFACFFYLVRLTAYSHRREAVPGNPFFYLFFLVAAVSSLRALGDDALIGLRKEGLYLLLFAAAAATGRQAGRGRFLVVLAAATSVLVSLDGLWQGTTGTDLFSGRSLITYPHLHIQRITASFQQAGSLAIYLGVCLPIILSIAFVYPAIALGGIPVFIALVLTLAPGAGLGFIAALGVMALNRKKMIFFSIFLLAAAGGLLLLPASLTAWPDGSLFLTLRGRFQMWQVASDIVARHPLLGSGWNTFGDLYAAACPPGFPFYREGAPYAHNMYIQLVAETGWLGLGAFLMFLGTLMSKARSFIRAHRQDFDGVLVLGLCAGLTAYLTHGLLESSLQTSQGALLFWLVTGLLTGLTSRKA